MHMKAKLYTYQQPRTTAVTQLACVCSVVNGRARSVLLEGCEIPVVAQLDQVSRVNFGDQVLVCETPSGLVVSGRIAAPDEAPAPRFELIEGVCTISCESDLCLKTAHGSVRINADGQIFIDGKQIINQASGPVRLQGSVIELN